ncbi:MAG: LysR family transcriptional regulator [Devosiaceae bacterium]|nr:LysR family transcriptional regulator [Devosiaceae bacterium MH13]
MDWNDCRMFLAVARAGQMLAAARALGTNQATVSRRMKKLERDLDVRLLDRRPHGTELTDEGKALLARLERAETELLDAQEALSLGRERVGGTIRVGAPDGFGTAFLAPRLPDFARSHPDLKVQLVPLPRAFSLSQREADLAVVIGRPRRGLGVTRKLMDYTLGLYASEAYLAEAPAITSPADLRNHRLVGYVDDLIYTPSLDYAHEVLRDWDSHFSVASALGQQAVVTAGGGIGILHDYLVTPQMGVRRVLPNVSIKRSYWIVYPEDLRQSRRVRAFCDFLIGCASAAP